MTQSKIWLSSPHMGGTEQQFIKEAFDANWVAPLGPNVNGFEKDLEDYLKENIFSVIPNARAILISLPTEEIKSDWEPG